MFKRLAPIVLVFLSVGTVAHAQYGGGRGGGHGGQGQPPPGNSGTPPAAPAPPPVKPPKPMNTIEITGVVQAVDPAAKRVTITYDAVDELNWPRGTKEFAAYTTDMLKPVSVGEKVRFKLDSDQIAEIGAF